MLSKVEGQPAMAKIEVYGADAASDTVRWHVFEGTICPGLAGLLQHRKPGSNLGFQ